MQRKTLRFGKGFNVVLGNKRSRAAQMVIEPGGSEGDLTGAQMQRGALSEALLAAREGLPLRNED